TAPAGEAASASPAGCRFRGLGRSHGAGRPQPGSPGRDASRSRGRARVHARTTNRNRPVTPSLQSGHTVRGFLAIAGTTVIRRTPLSLSIALSLQGLLLPIAASAQQTIDAVADDGTMQELGVIEVRAQRESQERAIDRKHDSDAITD